jgi:hypothetical protein
VLIIGESSIGAYSAYHFISVLSLLLACIIVLFLHLLCTNHKCTQPCCFPLLLRRRRWTGILWRGVLGYVLPQLSFLWSYGVFHYFVSLRVDIVFRDITYVIIILYSWHVVICEPFWPYVWNNLSWVMHMMSTWFWHKNRVWQVALQPTARLGTLLPTSPTSTRGERVITTMIWDTSSNQLSHFHSCILF